MWFKVERVSKEGVVTLRTMDVIQFANGKDICYVNLGTNDGSKAWIGTTRARKQAKKGCEFYCKEWDQLFREFFWNFKKELVDTEIELSLAKERKAKTTQTDVPRIGKERVSSADVDDVDNIEFA